MKLVAWLKDFSKSIAKKRKTADNKLEDFLKAIDNNFNLNLVFNNLTNYAIAVLVFSVGLSSIKNKSFSSDMDYFYNATIDIFMIIAGFSLIMFNILSFLSATKNKKSRILFSIFNVLYILSVMKLFHFLVGSYISK